MKGIVICPRVKKEKEKENFEQLSIKMGELVAIVGNTGSGKSRLIQDIEQMVQGESFTKRKIICNPIGKSENVLVAHLSQSMKFVLDISVGEFIALHLESRGKNISIASIIEIVNTITPEAINIKMNLNLLSGGQTRAVMIGQACNI